MKENDEIRINDEIGMGGARLELTTGGIRGGELAAIGISPGSV